MGSMADLTFAAAAPGADTDMTSRLAQAAAAALVEALHMCRHRFVEHR